MLRKYIMLRKSSKCCASPRTKGVTYIKMSEYDNTIEMYGPKLWYLIHYFSLHYSPAKFCQFIEGLRYLIPCVKCRKHFNENLHQLDYKKEPDSAMYLWSYKIHNCVNEHLGKTSPSYQSSKALYQNENLENFWYIMYTFASNLDDTNLHKFKQFVEVCIKMIPSLCSLNLLKKFPNCIFPYSSQGMFLWIYSLNNAYNNLTNTTNDQSYKLKKQFFYSKCDKCDLHG